MTAQKSGYVTDVIFIKHNMASIFFKFILSVKIEFMPVKWVFYWSGGGGWPRAITLGL